MENTTKTTEPKKVGRPRGIYSGADPEKMILFYQQGYSYAAIGRAFGISRQRAYKKIQFFLGLRGEIIKKRNLQTIVLGYDSLRNWVTH